MAMDRQPNPKVHIAKIILTSSKHFSKGLKHIAQLFPWEKKKKKIVFTSFAELSPSENLIQLRSTGVSQRTMLGKASKKLKKIYIYVATVSVFI